MIGCIALCQKGKLGIIESGDDTLWKGRTIFPPEDFGKPWQSTNPRIRCIATQLNNKTSLAIYITGGNKEKSIEEYDNGQCQTTQEWIEELSQHKGN